MNIELTAPVDCLCDFTYDFYWQHRGSRLSPSGIIPNQNRTSYTYLDLVTSLKKGEDVHIKGDVGKRLGSSLGVDLMFFGGTGISLKVGSIIVDGEVDTRIGISMVSGAIYVLGKVKQPLGNVIEVESDRSGYHKYRSITGMLKEELNERIIPPNMIKEDTLIIKDGLIRDTIASRLDIDKKVIVEGEAGMSTGILMKRGIVQIKGDAGMNTGVLLNGGKVIVDNAAEFAGSYMRGGTLIIRGKSRGYVGAKMKGGVIYFKGQTMLKPVPASQNDTKELVKLLGISQIEAMMFKKYSGWEI
jgi:formylmethanofuran dehydrogenase subunit C